VNYIAVELENPFGDDWNDLPLEEMQDDMNRSLISLLRKHAVRPPKFDFVADRDKDLEKSLVRDFPSNAGGEVVSPAVCSRFARKLMQGEGHCTSSSRTDGHEDNCRDGNCTVGSGTDGLATDKLYRDGVLATVEPPAELRIEAKWHDEDASPPTPATVGRQEATEVSSPAGSHAALLPKAQPRASPGRGQWNRGAGQSRPSLGGADPASKTSQASAPRSPGRDRAPPHGQHGEGWRPPASPAGGLCGGVAGSLCLGSGRSGQLLGAERRAGSCNQRAGAPNQP